MRGDGNRQKKVKKAKSSQVAGTKSAEAPGDSVKPTQNEEAKTQANVDDGAQKFVNIENIQVNVTNEESKLCSDSTNSLSNVGKLPSEPASLESSMKSESNLLEVNFERKKTASESSSATEESANLNVPEPAKQSDLETTLTNSENQTGDVEQSTPLQQPQQQAEPNDSEYVNPRGVRFVQDAGYSVNAANLPYGLPCVRELLRFLISLISNKNSELMVSMGLNLITIGLESGIDHISSYQSLLAYVKDDLCKNLYDLLSIDRLFIYTNVLRVTFLLFESLRSHLKLQLEHFFARLMEIIVSESNKITYEQKEITIDFLVQMLRIPGFPIEIYLNYDCSLNSSNLFEDLTKLLSKVSSIF